MPTGSKALKNTVRSRDRWLWRIWRLIRRPRTAWLVQPNLHRSRSGLRKRVWDFSATNIQEAGVDEPDIVKTDGRRILAVGDGRLWYVDIAGEKPELLSSLALPNGRAREMFISGDRALLLISRRSNHYRGMAVLIDISDPERMDISETLRVSGEYVSARLVGERATAVFTYHSPPLPEFVFPASDSTKSLSRAEEFNRQVVRESTLADWVPSLHL